MDRRQFLATLGALGVMTYKPNLEWLNKAISKYSLPALPDADNSEFISPQDLAAQFRQDSRLFEISAVNLSNNQAGQLELRRLDNTLLQSFLIEPHSMLQYPFHFREQIVGPVKVVTPEFVEVRLVGTDINGDLVYATKSGTVKFLA